MAGRLTPRSSERHAAIVVAGKDAPLPQRETATSLVDARDHFHALEAISDRGGRFLLGTVSDVKGGAAVERIHPLLFGEVGVVQ